MHLYIPDVIEEGIDSLDPIQRSAAGMDIADLKVDFDREPCFWGGAIDVKSQLPFLSLEEIQDEVRKSFDVPTPGGGFLCFPSHNIQPDAALEKIDAFSRAS